MGNKCIDGNFGVAATRVNSDDAPEAQLIADAQNKGLQQAIKSSALDPVRSNSGRIVGRRLSETTLIRMNEKTYPRTPDDMTQQQFHTMIDRYDQAPDSDHDGSYDTEESWGRNINPNAPNHDPFPTDELRGDREFVIEAVCKDGMALQYAHEDFWKDEGVVLAAVLQNGRALQYASARLQDTLGHDVARSMSEFNEAHNQNPGANGNQNPDENGNGKAACAARALQLLWATVFGVSAFLIDNHKQINNGGDISWTPTVLVSLIALVLAGIKYYCDKNCQNNQEPYYGFWHDRRDPIIDPDDIENGRKGDGEVNWF